MAAAKLEQSKEMQRFSDYVRDGCYVLSEHVIRALMGGQVAVRDIERVLQSGHVLEEHQHTKRGTSYLVVGKHDKKLIHVVCAEGAGTLVVLFAYQPAPPSWASASRRAPIAKDSMRRTYEICYFCGGALKQITVGNFDYRLEGRLYVIKRVPARLCLECGEKYIDTEVGHRLNDLIEAQAFTTTEQVGVIEFQ